MRTTLPALALALAAASCDNSAGAVFDAVAQLPATASKVETVPLEVAANETIAIECAVGDVRIRVDDAAAPSATAKITARGHADEEAKSVLSTWKLTATRRGSTLTVRADGKPTEVADGEKMVPVAPQIELEVVVHAGVRAKATSQTGRIRVEGAFSDCDASTAFASVAVSGVRGNVAALSQSGDVEVDDVQGAKIEARTTFGAVHVRRAQSAQVDEESRSGDVTLEDCAKGRFSLVGDLGGIRVKNASGILSARTKNGTAQIAAFDGIVTVHSDFGGVDVAGTFDQIDASSQGGAVRVVAAAGSTAKQPWMVRSTFNSVTVGLPDDFACELEATSDTGDVTADYPAIGADARRSAHGLHAVLGSGGSRVGLRTQSGAVRIERSSR